MTKILITPKNSVWGVIVNPQSSNTYRHALSFASPALKEAFINKELFNGGDYKALLAAQPEISFSRMSATTATFVITPDQYPTETFLTLLNKDFCIIEEDGVEQFYTLSGERDKDGGNSIVFTAELDIFFTYNIKDMFNDKETRIERAMTDRFYKENNEIKPITDNKSLQFNSPLYNEEDLKVSSENLIQSSKRSKFYVDHRSLIKDISSLTEEDIEAVNDIMNSVVWTVLSSKMDATGVALLDANLDRADLHLVPFTDNYGNSTSADANGNTILNNYATIVTPQSFNYGISPQEPDNQLKIDNPNYTGSLDIQGFEDTSSSTRLFPRAFSQDTLDDANTIKTSFTILPFSPAPYLFSFKEPDQDNFITVTKETLSDGKINLKVVFTGYSCFKAKKKALDASHFLLRILPNYSHSLQFISSISPISTIYNSFIPDFTKNVSNSHPYELKAEFSPYRNILFNSPSQNSKPLIPQFFSTSEIKGQGNYRFLVENWGYWLQIKNYDNFSVETTFLDINSNKHFVDYTNYSLPTSISAWEEFLQNNKYQQNASFLSKGLSAGVGVLGLLAAPFTAGASLGIGVAAAGLAAKSASDINSQLAQRKDIKNQPDKLVNNGSTLSTDFTQKSFNLGLTEFTLPKIDQLLVREHFYKYGYTYKSKLFSINSLLSSRYYFNYISAPELFENISLQASAEIKQLINDTLNSGLTIWHVRDLNTFKGIKNYEFENVEMSLLTTQADEEVINDNRKEK